MKRRKRKDLSFASHNRLITLVNPQSPISESYRSLRTNIQFSGVDRELKHIMVTSSGPAEGKSTTIANLAVVTAQGEKKTLLIDADLRRPTAHHTFDLANRQGLTTVIAGQASLADVVQKTSEPMLDVVTAGPIPPNPAEMLASNAMSRIMSEASRHYDQIFYDCPPVIAVTDAQILASKVDGVIFVIDAGRTNKELALKAKNLLAIAQANVLGAVLNNKKMGRDSAYYYYYGRGK